MGSTPDDDELSRLATHLARVGGEQPSIPLADLARLADLTGDVVVDFEAAAVLGHPLVVWHAREPLPRWWSTLTPREQDVARLVTDGFTNAVIAARLGIRLSTVKDHVHAVLRKAGLRRRTQVAALLAPHHQVL